MPDQTDSLPKRSLKKVAVTGAKKRYKPSKHFVFIIQVTYSDDTEYVIYRRYSDFFKFQTSLLDKFPIEAGIMKEPRIIPYLPGRRPFARDRRKVAAERQGDLNSYCQTLIDLKDNISKSTLVKQFFEAKPTDIEPEEDDRLAQVKNKDGKINLPAEDGELNDITGPITLEQYQVIADYKAADRTEMSLAKDQIVDVVEKSDSGWWMIQIDGKQGWAPATYLQPLDLDEEVDNPEPIYGGEPHITLASHVSEDGDELSFDKDVILDVLHKNLDGWWVASYNGKVGYAPANYLKRYNDSNLQPTASVKDRRHLATKAHVPKRKTTLNPDLPREDLSIYQTTQFAIKRSEPSGPVYGNCDGAEGGDENDLIYENQHPTISTGIMGGTAHGEDDEDDEDDNYVDVGDGDTYVNIGEQNGIQRQADGPPMPPPKDYKPDLPPKAIVTPILPPKQAKVRMQPDVNTNNGNRERPVRRKRKDDNQNSSPNLSPALNSKSPSHSPLPQNQPNLVNVTNALNNRNNGIANDSELLKKLEARRRKNEQSPQAPVNSMHHTKPDVPIKTVMISPFTPKLPQRTGRQDDRPQPLPRTVHH